MTARQKAMLWGGVVVVCLVLVFVKVRLESGAALAEARVAKAKSDDELAGLLYRRAIRWYTPLSSSVADGVQELWSLAEERERAGKGALALQLYRDLRGALYAIRHVSEPFLDVRGRAEEKIAALMAKEPAATSADKQRSEDERRAVYLAQLRSVRAPDVAWSIALLFGFFGWLACAALFFWRGFTPEGALVPRPALRWGAAVVACFALWIVGMTQA